MVRNTPKHEFCLCVSLERLATFVLSIPEGIVERRTAVHPVRACTSIGRDCVGCFVGTWKGDCLGSLSRGQPRGALPLHQVTQRQFIKFADPMRRSGHNNLLHVLPRRVHIIWYQSLRFLSRIVLVSGRIDFIYLLSTNSQKENLQHKFISATDFIVCFIEF
jgi:hypothetical protein